MSDFFEGLAARSTGAATALRPRVASAYETHDAIEIVEQAPATMAPAREMRVAAEPTPMESPTPAAERIVVRDVVLTRTETREVPAPLPAIQEERFEPRLERAREHRHDHTHHQERIEQVREVLAVPDIAKGRAEAGPASIAVDGSAEGEVAARRHEQRQLTPQLTTDDRQPITDHRQPTTHDHQQPVSKRRPVGSREPLYRQPPTTNRKPAFDRQPLTDPIVRITIGRVEVRAVQPAQPPPRPAPPPAAEGPTLAEFLEQRERRK